MILSLTLNNANGFEPLDGFDQVGLIGHDHVDILIRESALFRNVLFIVFTKNDTLFMQVYHNLLTGERLHSACARIPAAGAMRG